MVVLFFTGIVLSLTNIMTIWEALVLFGASLLLTAFIVLAVNLICSDD